METRLGSITLVVDLTGDSLTPDQVDAMHFALLRYPGAYAIEVIRDSVLGATIRCDNLAEVEIITRTFPPFAEAARAECVTEQMKLTLELEEV